MGKVDKILWQVMVLHIVCDLIVWTWSDMLSMTMGEAIQFYGVKALDSWKYHQWSNSYQKRLSGKFQKSCKPMQLSYGKTYVITRLTICVLKYLRGLCRGILKALLACKFVAAEL